ncbi:hypothetical protein PCASD_20105 [Puccinia coronata f. sp. avenae]|uniref:Uncharacterized protein n=1 Tax=Puccinia coronata f. sp. avenae TaxID=200324 RepID=A0A2N5U5G7_9BASI|nr:hypothetical protein PCASD_20105 [Puccinia coronata f. sp. avenae]
MPAGWETLPLSWCDASWPGDSPAKLIHFQLVGRLSCQAATLLAGWEALPTSWYCTGLSRDSPGKPVKYQPFGKAGPVQALREIVLTTCYHTHLLGSSPDKLVQYQLVGSCCSRKLTPNQAALAVGAAVSGQVAQKRYSCTLFSFSAFCCAALKLITFRKKRKAAKFSFSCSAFPAAEAIWPEQVAVLLLRCAKTPLFLA